MASDHFGGLGPHVTLLSEELIGIHILDNSTNKGSGYGSNHWGESGTANATRGLRPWLNSGGIHSDEGFYRAFSESFKSAVLTTTVPNREWLNGNAYTTSDKVFMPSTIEYGNIAHRDTCQIGFAYPCGYEENSVSESFIQLPPGTTLQDKYLLGRVLGYDSFGITYLAWDKILKIKAVQQTGSNPLGIEQVPRGEDKKSAAHRIIKELYQRHNHYTTIIILDLLKAKALLIKETISQNMIAVVRIKQQSSHINGDTEGLFTAGSQTCRLRFRLTIPATQRILHRR